MHDLKISEDQIEARLKLPVVVSQPESAVVLNRFATRYETFSKDEVREIFGHVTSSSNRKEEISGLSHKLCHLKRRKRFCDIAKTKIKLYVRLPQLAKRHFIEALTELANYRLVNTGSIVTILDIVIDTGPEEFSWDQVLEIVQILSQYRNRFKVELNISVNATFICPNEGYMDFIVRHKVTLRYILGASLGYGGNLGAKEAEVLSKTAEYGLRVPILYYYDSDDEIQEITKTARTVLHLNKMSGISVLPSVSSQFYVPKPNSPIHNHYSFSKVLDALCKTPVLYDSMDEPITDIEERIACCDSTNFVQLMIKQSGDIASFRSFPFAVLYNSRSITEKVEKAICERQLSRHLRCKTCGWRHICGGVDSNHSELSQKQYGVFVEDYCNWRKATMRQIINECLDIGNTIQNANKN